MKKQILFFFATILFLIVGCSREDDFGGAAELQPIEFRIDIKYDNDFGAQVAANVNVVLKNMSTGETVNGITDENGELKLDKIMPGTYNVVADITLEASQYLTMFNEATSEEDVNFNASQEKVVVNDNNKNLSLVLKTGYKGGFVIKQYYYAGSDTAKGALFRDQFFEIHNNSDQVLYADGLYIALLEGNTNSNVTSYTLQNGQFDWSKSVGNNVGSAANTDYVYANAVIKVPGSGTTYPIQPGQSFVVAQTAINHKAPFMNNGGVEVEILDPSLTVDLSKAEFETYLGDYLVANGGSVFASDIQNPAVPDMEIISWDSGNRDMLLNSTHRPALVILKNISESEFASYPKFHNPAKPDGYKFTRIPTKAIMDGVDITNKALSAPKDLPTDIDAGVAYIKNEAGEAYADYTSFSVIRKTKKIVDGRVVLQDTNNSTNDFVTIKANPKGYAN